ncbi:MAG: DUF3341 domain-containing protein [Candidatus Cyclobacteriaceae bacterium M3_2C_046]
MEAGKNYILGIFDDEDVLVKAVEAVRSQGLKIQEVYSPFPVHGLDHALGYKRSRLPIVAFMFGVLGCFLALLMQFWMMGVDWPMIIGGKPYAGLPGFIPPTFEVTVLLAALGMVGTFMVVSDFKPYKRVRIYDIRSTDDKHVMALDLAYNTNPVDEIKQNLMNVGAVEVYKKVFD